MNTREGKRPPKSRPLRGFTIWKDGAYLMSMKGTGIPSFTIYKHDAMRFREIEQANRVYRALRERMSGKWSVRRFNALDGSERIVWQ